MTRPPRFSEVARRHRLFDCAFADPACAVRRYCDRVLVCGLELDPAAFREFFANATVETAVERGWRLVALDSAGRYAVVAVAGWSLPPASLSPVVAADGVLLDFDRRRCFDRRQLP